MISNTFGYYSYEIILYLFLLYLLNFLFSGFKMGFLCSYGNVHKPFDFLFKDIKTDSLLMHLIVFIFNTVAQN